METSLDDLTKEINVRLTKSYEYECKAEELAKFDKQKAKDHRIAAGLLLIEARKIIESGAGGDITWTIWCRKNVNRSRQDIHKIMKLAGHVEPEAALAAERARNRAYQDKYRKNAENVADTTVSDTSQNCDAEQDLPSFEEKLAQLVEWFGGLTVSQQGRLLGALENVEVEKAA
jgi:hypothetical protein